jgi:hypothetical protein
MALPSHTNSSLKTARRCLREYDLKYRQGFAPIEEESEALIVGSAWHALHEVEGDVYAAIEEMELDPLWRERLRRMWAAYTAHYADDGLEILEVEYTFSTEIAGLPFQGQIDAIVRDASGRVGILERKTTASDISATSRYWERLDTDTQIGIYSLACEQYLGRPADMIIYDVVCKPRSRPKKLTKKVVEEVLDTSCYGGVPLLPETLELVQDPEATHENLDLYGAPDPSRYFARKELARSAQQVDNLLRIIRDQDTVLRFCDERDHWPQNPDSCWAFGRACDFYAFCNRGEHPRRDAGVPEGFRLKESSHEELL